MDYLEIIDSVKNKNKNKLTTKFLNIESKYNKEIQTTNLYFIELLKSLLNLIDDTNKNKDKYEYFFDLAYNLDLLIFLLSEIIVSIINDVDSINQLSILNLHSNVLGNIYEIIKNNISNDNLELYNVILKKIKELTLFDENNLNLVLDETNSNESLNLIFINKLSSIKKDFTILFTSIIFNE